MTEPPHGSTPSGKPIAVPRSHGFHDRRHSSRLIPVKSCSVTANTSSRPYRHAWYIVSPTANRPMTRMTTSMPSSSCGMPKEKRALAGELIDPDEPERQAEKQAEESAHDRRAEQRRHGREREHRQGEVLRRAEAQRHRRQRRREERQRDRGERAGDKRSDRRRSSARRRRGPVAPSCARRSPWQSMRFRPACSAGCSSSIRRTSRRSRCRRT